LEDITLSIRAGEKVAILGKVGSGKSSIEKILLSLYRPTEGAVFIDQTNIAQIDPAELRNQIGLVFSPNKYYIERSMIGRLRFFHL